MIYFVFIYNLMVNVSSLHLTYWLVSVLTCAIFHGYPHWSEQSKNYKILKLLLLSSKHSALRSKSKDWLARNSISGVMVSMLALSVVDHGLIPLSGQAKDYEIGICCFSAKHTSLPADCCFSELEL